MVRLHRLRHLALPVVVTAALLAMPGAPARATSCPQPSVFISSAEVGTNLAGCSLPNSGFFGDFTGADFSGANLSGSSFFTALDGANFTNANLSGTRIGNPDSLNGQSFSMNAATLTGATITGVTWSLVRGRNLIGQPGALDPTLRIVGGILVGPRMDLSGADLSTRSLTNMNLAGARLSDANLSGANLTSANLAKADLSRANLTGARLGLTNLRQATMNSTTVVSTHFAVSDMTGVVSGGLVGTPADMPAAWRITLGRVLGPGVDMREENLAGADLRGMNLNGFDLTGTDLSSANLDGATLAGAKLPGANLERVHAFGTRFVLADLTGANLRHALLRDSNLQRARLHDANFESANLVGVDFRHAFLSGPNVAFDCTPAVVPGAVRHGAGECVARFIPQDQRPAVLRNTRSTGARFQSVNLQRVDLSGSDLKGANFTGANLTRANLTGADLDRTVFTDATMMRTRATGLTGTADLLPAMTVLARGTIVGPGLDLSNLDLGFLRPILLRSVPIVSLQGTNLRRAVVSDLPLSRYSLRNAITVNVQGNPASLPSGWHKRGGTMLGPGVDLSFSEDNQRPSLENVNTRDISLAGARLRNLYIPGRRLEKPFLGANLGGASTLRGADLTGSIIDQGVTPDVFLQGKTDLRDARLVNVLVTAAGREDGSICNADLTGANLSGITMDHLVDSDVGGANLNGTILRGARLSGAPQALKQGDFLRRGYLIGPGHDLGGADLSGLDLHGRNLEGLKLKYKRSSSTFCGQPEFDGNRPANLSGANLSGTNLDGLIVDGFSMFGLGERSKVALDARNTNFNGANLRNARLSAPFGSGGLESFNAHSDGATFRGTDARGADLVLSGRIDLTSADLRGARLSIDGGFLNTVTLTGATFNGDSRVTNLGTRGQGDVVSSRITGIPAELPAGWRLSGGRLLKD